MNPEDEVQFGTSGLRGPVAGLSDPLCYDYVARFLTAVAPGAPAVVLGHDLRPSSPRLARACAAAVRARGAETIYVGALPTPAVAYYAARLHLPALVVTGSHIPFDRNGIKFYSSEGEITKAQEAAMLAVPAQRPARLRAEPLPRCEGDAAARFLARYVDHFGAAPLAGQRLALYEHSSVARDLLRQVLVALGAQVIPLGRTDTFVAVDTEAVDPATEAQARRWAGALRFDAILSTDGDGDRPLLGDAQGQWLRGDTVGLLCARALGADTVVTPVSSNSAVERCGAFRRVIRTRIGSPHVLAAMAEAERCGVVVGYEANGGVLLGSAVTREGRVLAPLLTRDAFLPLVTLLAAGTPLAQLAAELPRRFTASDRLPVATAASQALLARLHAAPEEAAAVMAPDAGAVTAREHLDGLRLHFAQGVIVHLRASGNAPELRCYTEAETPERARALCAEALARVRERLACDATAASTGCR